MPFTFGQIYDEITCIASILKMSSGNLESRVIYRPYKTEVSSGSLLWDLAGGQVVLVGYAKVINKCGTNWMEESLVFTPVT